MKSSVGPILKGHKILYVDGEYYLSYKCCSIYYNNERIANLPLKTWKRAFSHCRAASRLLRLDPRCVERVDDNRYILEFKRNIWIVDISKHSVDRVMACTAGFSGTLNFCRDNENVYWGDYGPNPQRQAVSIYKLNADSKADAVYRFDAGKVRHIHNIIFDKKQLCFWVLAGDNEATAGIYKASLDWKNVVPVCIGKPHYRAVVGFPYNGGLLYATDSVMNENYLYFLSIEGNVQQLESINGSCIYGTENADAFFFATTVEPDETQRGLFSNKLGGGIKDRYVHLVRFDKAIGKTSFIAKYKKDWLPMRLFKYGTIHFPKGQQDNHDLLIYPVGVSGVDGTNIKIE